LVLTPQHFGSLVYDRRAARYLGFDRQATDLLHRLGAVGVGGVMGQADEGDRAGVLAFVEGLDARRFFRLDGRLDVEFRHVEDIPADHLVGPLVVHLEVIAACNLACAHCFAGELPRNERPLSVGEMQGLFADLSRLGSFRLGVTGGEPLLRKDLFDVLDAALAEGLQPSLTTNALLITEEVARALGRRPDVWLTASLEGPTALSNDPVRGAGTFDAVMEKLALLRRHAEFALSFTITRANAHLVGECSELARRVGARAAVFRPLYPAGSALAHMELMPSAEQYAEALDRLAELGEGAPPGEAPQACGAGRTLCSISVRGDVNPCSFMGAEFETGNIRARPFESIWRDGRQMRRMRSDGHQGGCRARSLRLAGSLEASDSWMTAHERGGCYHPSTNLEVTSRLSLPVIGGT
jgi:MoaA/NifB/PqqE/SkfB family radical SAM enzyme